MKLLVKKSVALCLVLVLHSLQAQSSPQEPRRIYFEKPVEWADMVEIAVRSNPDLLESRHKVDSIARSRDIAFGDYLPSVSGDANKSRTSRAHAASSDSLEVGVSAEQTLFSGFETTGNFLQAQKNLEAARFDYRVASAQIRYRLRSVYIELLKLKKLLEVSRRIEARREKNAELIQLRYEAGREHLGSSMRAQAIADQAQFEVRQILRRIESQSYRLRREMGEFFDLPVEIADDLDRLVPLSEEEVAGASVEALILHQPEVLRDQKTAEAFKSAMLAAQASIWPNIGGFFNYSYSGARSSELEKESILGIRISVPFFEGGKNIGEIRKAKSNYAASKESARSTADELTVELAEAKSDLMDALEFVRVRKSFLEAARKRSEIVRQEYETGLVNFQDFDIAEQEIADSEKSYVESLANVLIQNADWDLAQGLTLEDALA